MGVLRTGAGDTPVPSIGKPSSSAVADDSGIASEDLVSAASKRTAGIIRSWIHQDELSGFSGLFGLWESSS
jgi:hypothetical protein